MDHNFAVLSKHDHGLTKAFFGKEEVWVVQPTFTMLDVLVKVGVFESKGQARKNWKGPVAIPSGWSVFERVGKLRHSFFILNAVHDPDCSCDEGNFVAQAIKDLTV